MEKIGYIFYDFFAYPLFRFAIFLLSFFNSKVKRGLIARKKLFSNLIINFADIDRTKPVIWVHSASMGEFEQAKPIIERFKTEFSVNILVTFFSPSGYENSLKYKFADVISYLPFDRNEDIQKFINLTNPSVVILMRYDIWPNMVKGINKNRIPLFLVDATMREKTNRKLPFIKTFHQILFNQFTQILTISKEDKKNFESFDLLVKDITAIGDTRFDRVNQKSLEAKARTLFKEGFFGDNKVIILGSSWEADESVILPALMKLFKYNYKIKLIIVPHEPTEQKLENLEAIFHNKISTIRFSHLNDYKDEKIIIIDSIGILLSLYSYANIAYVGGSFKQGIHNVLEPAVYGIPVVYGPKIENSQEALTLHRIGGGFVIKDKKQAYRIFRTLLLNDEYRILCGEKSRRYVQENIGATDHIISAISRYLK